MLYTIMRSIRNFFPLRGRDRVFKIENGTMDLSELVPMPGQYIRIEGSVFNDGVYRFTDSMNLQDEVFNGRVTLLAPPREFLDLAAEIESYVASGKDAGPYVSESFGGYTYTKATGASGGVATWQDVFRTRLNAWRKI